MKNTEFFPDGSFIDAWFYNIPDACVCDSSKKYILTDYGIKDDGHVYTQEIQSLIEKAYLNGGGTIVVPQGTYVTGSLFFRQNVHLCIEKDGVLKGSDDISHYPVCDTRIEGESCLYFSALINADGIDGFKLFGQGTVDGNGHKAWKAFWERKKWNPECTNKDEQRSRILYISNCTNTVVCGLNFINSQFWTTHYYKCNNTKIINCNFFAPSSPIPAPSSDGIDIDACKRMLIKNCSFNVHDDAIALKGGKGPYADTTSENGENEFIIIEDCRIDFCHACLTCGSESIHNKNVIMRRIDIKDAWNLLRLKMRPDTPQHYEYITVSEVTGQVESFININPWTQFFDLKGRKEIPISKANNIILKCCDVVCNEFFDVEPEETQYKLSDFRFVDLIIKAKTNRLDKNVIKNFQIENVLINERYIN